MCAGQARLRALTGCNEPWGGMSVILSGDPAQLPPVKSPAPLFDLLPRTPPELAESRRKAHDPDGSKKVRAKRWDCRR